MKETKERFAKIAKLLAEENLTVSFEKVETASFDLDKRVLRLPIFNDELPDDVYGMMVAHEVSHALNTPNQEWYDWIDLETPGASVRKSYANVLEDVRIERLIKRRFPGIVRDMKMGYDTIHKRNFFGLDKDEDLSQRQLIDRINLFFKSYGHLNVPFTEDEKVWLDKAEATETFADVLKLARELIEYQKEENKKEEEQQSEEQPESGDKGEDSDDSSEESPMSSDNTEESDDGENGDSENDDEIEAADIADETETGDSEDTVKEVAGDSEQNDEASNDNASDSIDDESADNVADNVVPDSDLEEANTDSSMEDKFKEHTEDASYAPSFIAINDDFVKDNYDKFLVSTETYLEKYFHGFEREILLSQPFIDNMNTVVKENKKYVTNLVSEFERKHSARMYKKARESKTGSLDMNKLNKYRWTDNIFLSGLETPEGQSHGIVMMIDFSGSMNSIIGNVLKQVFNLVTFCDRLHIPYEVYAFTNSPIDQNNTSEIFSLAKTANIGSIIPDGNMRIVNLISSTSPKETRTMIRSWMAMTVHYSKNIREWWDVNGRKYDFFIRRMHDGMLSSTPLNSALALSTELMRRFRKATGVEKIHYVLFSDGGASDGIMIQTAERQFYLNGYSTTIMQTLLDEVTHKTYSRDRVQKYAMFSFVQTIMTERIASVANTNMIGFFLVDDRRQKSNSKFNNEVRQVLRFTTFQTGEELNLRKSNGVFTKQNVGGFNHYTFVSTKILSPEAKTLDDMYNGKKSLSEAATSTVATAFAKTNNHNNSTKFLVRDIIHSIA